MRPASRLHSQSAEHLGRQQDCVNDMDDGLPCPDVGHRDLGCVAGWAALDAHRTTAQLGDGDRCALQGGGVGFATVQVIAGGGCGDHVIAQHLQARGERVWAF